MHHTAPGGVSQSTPPVGSSGDVDADGEIVGALKRRLDEAIGPVVDELDRDEHLARVFLVCTRAKLGQPGVRVVEGEPRYSAAWLDAEAGAR